jgi:hypothetical protein
VAWGMNYSGQLQIPSPNANFIDVSLDRRSHQRDVAAILRVPGITKADLDPDAPVTLWPFGIQARYKMAFTVREHRKVCTVVMAFFDARAIFDATPRASKVPVTVETKLWSGQYVNGCDFVLVRYPSERDNERERD